MVSLGFLMLLRFLVLVQGYIFAPIENVCVMDTLKEAFYAKYPENHRILGYFEEANGCECTWENLSKVGLHKYVAFLGTRLAPNGVRSYCSKLKSVMTSYNEEVELPKDYEKILNVKHDASEHVYLNDEEIRRIIVYQPTKKAERVVKNWFLIGCLTGARHSDYIRFTTRNIRDGELHYVSVKTHINTIIPLCPYVEELIRENEKNGYNELRYSDVWFNKNLRRICKCSGITEEVSLYTGGKFQCGEKWRFVASHCARRSFATNLYRNGVDIYTISRLCGHSSVEMTKHYICCGPMVNDNVMAYLNGFIAA